MAQHPQVEGDGLVLRCCLAGGGTGEGLLEIYDLDPSTDSNLVNMSTRGLVRSGNGALISGCSIKIVLWIFLHNAL